jgi:type II protein arginine methyltransferase
MLDSIAQADHLLAQAADAYRHGDFARAETLGRAALEADATAAPVRNLLGLTDLARGDPTGAIARFQQAAALDPQNAEYPNNLGFVLHGQERLEEARGAFLEALAIDPLMAHAANNLGSVLEKLGEHADAIGWYRRALEVDPAFVEASDNLLAACARVAPQWHFPMIADAPRNLAYGEALARVAPGRRVLDIGSGSGLLAMMAANAGAAHVASCEMQPVIAGLARTIVAANGLGDKVDILPLKSNDLEVGRDLSERAEVLVTETFSSGLLSEQVLATVEDAHARLLTPDAIVVPRRASAVGKLIGGDILEGHFFARPWTGLNLSSFDVLAPQRVGLHLDRLPHLSLSDDFEIVGFDLTETHFPPEKRFLAVEATRAGRCVGVAQWIRLELDAATTYENHPSEQAGANGWMHVVYRFPRAIDVQPGQVVTLIVGHNRSSIAIGLSK